MPFCFAPWSNIDISPPGDISPCCKFRHRYYTDQPLNIKQHGPSAYLKSKTLETVKQDFQLDRWPKGCERCRIEEENGIASKRQLDHDRWQRNYQDYDISTNRVLTASVAFGNTCNLVCITCNPFSSSRWQREHFMLHGQDVPPNHFYRDDFVDEFLDLAPDIIHLDIPGGEPFLSGVVQQKQLLQRLIDQGRAHEISIHYTTNATIWPGQDWWDLWQHFKEIDMQLSIDGVGSRYEYIRWPGEWSQLLHNVNSYQQQQSSSHNLRLSVSHTVSAYNVYYIPEFLDWIVAQGLPRPWMGRVNDPIYMRPSVWPSAAKQCIIDNLDRDNVDCRTWADLISNTDDSDRFDLFRERLAWHDRYRGLDFMQTFPEMANFL